MHMLDHAFIVPYNANRPSYDFVQVSIPNNQGPITSIKFYLSILVSMLTVINCQSIQSAEKRARFYAFIDFHKPDIVIGTESWLHKDIPDCEVFPASLGFNPPIRKDRPGDT